MKYDNSRLRRTLLCQKTDMNSSHPRRGYLARVTAQDPATFFPRDYGGSAYRARTCFALWTFGRSSGLINRISTLRRCWLAYTETVAQTHEENGL